MTVAGRSGAKAPSGSRPSDRAAKRVSPVPASIPNAENLAPIFRRGMGIVIEAIDSLRAEIAKSGKLSASVRRYDDALSQMLDHMSQDSRTPWLIQDYKGAADVSNCIGYGIKHMVRVLAPLAKPEKERAAQAIEARRAETLQDGSVHESAVPKGCAQ